MSSAPTDHPGTAAPLRLLRSLRSRHRQPPQTLWLGPDGLWDHGARPGRWPWGRRALPEAGVAQHASFDAWCQGHPGQACSLVLSGWLLHELLLSTDTALADDQARLRLARQLLQHYHGEAAAHWSLTAWQAGGQHGVSALHAFPLQALQASARRHGVALRAVRPWWSVALAMALQQQPRLGTAGSARLLVIDGALVTQIDLAHSRLTALAQRRLAEPSLAALEALHDSLPPVQACAALGHGLRPPAGVTAAAAAAGGIAGVEGAGVAPATVQALGPLHGTAPRRLAW